MSFNLLVWKWSEDLDTTSKRRQCKMSDVAASFAEGCSHPAIGRADFSVFLAKVVEQFGNDELNRPFVLEDYGTALVFNYGSGSRFEIVPILGQLASSCGLNGTEF